HRPRLFSRRPPIPSASRQQSRSSRAANPHQRSSQRASAGSSYRRSSVVSFRLVLSNPTLSEITDGYEIQLHHGTGHDRIESLTFNGIPFVPEASPVNNAPVLATPIADISVQELSSFSYQIPADAFVDPDNDPLTISVMLADG